VALDLVDGSFQLLGNGHDWDAAFQTIPAAINSSGTIVGQFTDFYGTWAAFWVPYNLFLRKNAPAPAIATMALPANLPAIAVAAHR
jgi:hypothetical protein